MAVVLGYPPLVPHEASSLKQSTLVGHGRGEHGLSSGLTNSKEEDDDHSCSRHLEDQGLSACQATLHLLTLAEDDQESVLNTNGDRRSHP